MSYGAYTTARDTKRSDGRLISCKMAAVKLCKGTLVCTNSSTGSLGYATHTPVASYSLFLGVAYETVDNSAGSSGDKSIRVEAEGVHAMVAASADQSWVGKKVYWSTGSSGDNATVVISDPGTEMIVGEVVEVVSATEVRVKINKHAFNGELASAS
jgi:predicted RecA/RadA family phage recombinase